MAPTWTDGHGNVLTPEQMPVTFYETAVKYHDTVAAIMALDDTNESHKWLKGRVLWTQRKEQEKRKCGPCIGKLRKSLLDDWAKYEAGTLTVQ